MSLTVHRESLTMGAKMRRLSLFAAALITAMLSGSAVAQESAGIEAPPLDASQWEFGASLFAYFVPQDRDYASPVVTADRGGLHLEGRYNYEGIHTGSVFVGWNFESGEKLKLQATPIVGGVFGDTRGLAPGLELTLSWRKFELYSESEYVIDFAGSSENFFYNWAQLGYSAADWLTVGLASQRTRTYHTGLDVQRGIFVGFSHKSVTLDVYVFNFGWETPTVVSSVSVTF
jgi:hypothetical protein